MASYAAYFKLLQYFFHLILYSILTCCQLLYWRLSGVHRLINNCQRGESYELFAHLLRVWGRCKPTHFTINYRRHSLSTHVKVVHPELALQDNVSLMTLTDKEAIFVVTSPDENLYNTRKWPFFFQAQFVSAEFILIMLISSFHRLASVVGDPQDKVVWSHQQGRCGSTATCQAFNALPSVCVIAEPLCTFSLDQAFKYKYFKHWGYDWESSKEYKLLYQSAVRVLLKPREQLYNLTVVKCPGMIMKTDLRLLSQLFPEFINIYLYREVRSQVGSIFKAAGGLMIEREVTLAISSNPILSWLFPMVKPVMLMNYICSNSSHVKWIFNKENTRKRTKLLLFLYHWCESCFHYKLLVKQFRDQTNILAFRFEDFQSNPKTFFHTVFNSIKVNVNNYQLSLIELALIEDSQRSSQLSRAKVAKSKEAQFVEGANKYLNWFELPKWGESIVLPNTVECVSKNKMLTCTWNCFRK